MKIIISIVVGIILLAVITNSSSQQPTMLSENHSAEYPTAVPTIVQPTEKALKVAFLINQVLSDSDWATLLQNHNITPSTTDEEIKDYALWMDSNPDALTKNEAIIVAYLSEQEYDNDYSFEENTTAQGSNSYSIYNSTEPTPTPEIAVHGNASSYNQIGNTVFGSDGSTYQRIGNTVFGNDGSTYQKIGNTTFSNDGESYQDIGNTTFGSDGSTYQQIGNTTFGSDGTTCQKIGSTTFCN